MTEPCECCDLDPAYCGKAAEKRLRAEAAAEKTAARARGALQAQYAGSCGKCGDWYGVGTWIGPPVTPGGSWLGECCT